MFGLWIWAPPERGRRQRTVEKEERIVLHTRFYCVRVLRGERTPEALIRRLEGSALELTADMPRQVAVPAYTGGK